MTITTDFNEFIVLILLPPNKLADEFRPPMTTVVNKLYPITIIINIIV